MSVMLFTSSYTFTVTSPHPSTQKRCVYYVYLGFVVLLNAMTNSYYLNTSFAGNSKDLAVLPHRESGLCSFKTFVLQMSVEKLWTALPKLSYLAVSEARKATHCISQPP
jgi:hypothetical protein